MSELKSPEHSLIKKLIKENTLVDFCTVNDKILRGTIIWFDKSAFRVKLENNSEITLMKKAVIYYCDVHA
jgi:hypothetical protein